MTQANVLNYELAAALVEAGAWQVDPAAGLVYGKRGLPFRRTNSWGYIQIKFRDADNWRVDHAVLAHRVVWESVHGPIPIGLTINHIDGNKQNNSIANLEAISQVDNMRHAYRTGLAVGQKGEESGNARLTDDAVRLIYAMAWRGDDQRTIGAMFGVGSSIVSNIKQGWAWTHITGHQRAA